MEKRKRRAFTDEYKAEAVRLVLDQGMTATQVAKDLNLSESALCKWVKQTQADAGKRPEGARKSSEREELTKLRRENRRLRMEREILKKARLDSTGQCYGFI